MNDQHMTLPVTEIQRFCMHDGPGVRTVVFFKGCPLRCAWCHNPEAQNNHGEMLYDEKKCIFCGGCNSVCAYKAQNLTGNHVYDRSLCKACGLCAEICPTEAMSKASEDMTVEDIRATVLRDRSFYGENGGVTFSGGEPMMHPEGVLRLLSLCKEAGLHTAIETSGEFSRMLIPTLVKVCDLFLWDVKDTDDGRHRRYTGVSNQLILQNLRVINALGARIRLRCILVAGVNTTPTHYTELAKIASTVRNFDGLELIPYHAYGGAKSTLLGLADSGRTDWIPSREQIGQAQKILRTHGVSPL